MKSTIRQLFTLAWPVMVAQVAAVGNGVLDTVMAGRLSAVDLAAVSLGVAIYVSVYIGLMGVLLAIAPIVARHWGAGRFDQIAAEARQGVWLALALSVIGCPLIGATDLWFAIAAPPEAVAKAATGYLIAIAAALPAALLFRVYYALQNGLGQPRVIMAILLGGLILKVPLNALFMYGGASIGLDAIAPMGGAGCAVSTACVAWAALAAAIYLLSHDAQYRRMGLWPWRLGWPEPDRLRELLRQGVPTGLSYLIEVTSFTFIALFVARFGAVVGASHQIVANLAALTYMVPLSIANATSTLTARALGAGDPTQARRASILGLQMALTTGILITATILLGKSQILWAYSNDPTVIAAAMPLIIWIGIFHLFDAAQTVLSFSLRAYQVSTLPMGIYALSLWGIGLGGGAWLTFGAEFGAPTVYFAGALGFWVATTVGLALAAALLGWLQWRVWQQTAPTSTV